MILSSHGVMNHKIFYGASLAALILGGCQTTKVGPKALRSFQGAYNEVITMNTDEQLLQNIVRLRYRDNPVFVEVNDITQSNGVDNSGDSTLDKTFVGADAGKYVGKGIGKLGLASKNSSTIKFSQLKGKDFVNKLMTPIQRPIVLSMMESGWRPERVFNLCVERVNNLYNAQTAGGPTPRFAPDYKPFYQWTDLLTRLYRSHVIDLGEKPDTNFSDLYLVIHPKPGYEREISKFKELAGLKSSESWFKFKDNFADMSSTKLVLRCRTLLAMLFFLSQGVDVPEKEKLAGLVTTTKNPDGSNFNWSDISNRLLNVRFSESSKKMRPEGAYVSCRYRGKWFYISDNDAESKATFLMISQIFALQSAASYKPTSPTLVLAR